MLITILIAAAIAIGVFMVIVAMQPTDFCIKRTAAMSAPPSVVFAQVNDLPLWEAWSPWEKIDPAVKRVFEGPSAGIGASYSWSGNNKAGEGRMTITESRPGELIRMKLEFKRPFTATHAVEFTFTPEGDQTVATWSMSGKNNFVSKAFVLFMNCDKMIGDEFEKGLSSLKSIAEAKNHR